MLCLVKGWDGCCCAVRRTSLDKDEILRSCVTGRRFREFFMCHLAFTLQIEAYTAL